MRKLDIRELGRVDADSYRLAQKIPVILVLDNIRSGLNVGSAFRTADAFRIEEIVLCGITATPPHREIQKTALGATESVRWRASESVTDALAELKSREFFILGIEQTDRSVPLQDLHVDPNQRYALVFGNEVRGISEEALPFLDGAVEIPQAGTKHSLNVSVCIGILCWTFFVPHLNYQGI
jgi:tRNA G18 (ribose-2'-O)-methylase SpoU